MLMPRLPPASIRFAVLGRRGAISGVVETTPSSPAPPVLQRVLAEGTVHVSVNLVCSCAGTPADCSAPCGSGEAPSVFVDLVATRDYSGIVLSILQLRAENRVQIR
jgi:hypothetical protein